MKKQFFRICSTVLIIALLVNMLPMSIFAAEFRESLAAEQEVALVAAEAADAQIVTEIPSKRTQYSKEFLLSNGLHLAAVYPDAVHYEKDGSWAEIDNTLALKKGGYVNTAGVWNVSFPQQLSESKQVTIEKDGYTLSFAMAGELRSSGELMTAAIGSEPAEQLAVSQMQVSSAAVQQFNKAELQAGYRYAEMAPEKLYSRLTYGNVYPDTDIVYDMAANRVKESIVMSAYSSTLRGYKYTLQVGEMIPVLEEDGQILFYDKEHKNVVMAMPAPYLVDAAEEFSWDIRVQLTGGNGTYTLTYLLPTQWLADDQRAWPVILDPAVVANLERSNIRDVTVSSEKTYSHNWGINSCGRGTESGITRTYLKYNELPDITSSDVVVFAQLGMYREAGSTNTTTIEVHKVSGTWESEDLGWGDQDGIVDDDAYEIAHDPVVEDYAIVNAYQTYTWNVTDIVQGWYESGNTGMMFKAPDSVEQGTTKSFKQFLSSDYGTESSRPLLVVYFRNNNGLEGYWDYTASSAGRAGTGYINHYTGNLTWVRNDIGFDGNRMPVSIQHVYNLNDAIIPDDTNNSNDSGGNTFGMGTGWRTNYNQLVYHWNLSSSAVGDYYVWEDGDGTDHYFLKESNGEYKDEDGLNLTLTTSGSGNKKYCITDDKDNKRYFDTNGRLTSIEDNQPTPNTVTITYTTTTGRLIQRITDGAGRKYNFTYTNGLLSRISYTGKGTSEYSHVAFTYTGTNLTQITDADTESVTFTYEDSRLETAKDVDGYQLTYTYKDAVESWQPYRVLRVAEQDTANNANGGTLDFAYGHNQTTITDHNGNTEIWQFNDFGNTRSIQDNEGHATFAGYAREIKDDTDGKANQLRLGSKLQNTVVNYLKYSNYDSSSVTNWTPTTDTVTAERSTEQMHIGRAGVKMVTGTTGTETGVANSSFTASENSSYTFSAYVKTGAGAVWLAISDGSTTVRSEALPANSDWTRLQVTYTNETSANKTITPKILTETACTTFIDSAQLEKEATASRFNLIENGDFRHSTTTWTSEGFSMATLTQSATPELDGHVMSVTGDPSSTKKVYQYALIPGAAGDSYVVSGWAKGNSAPLSGDRKFGIQVTFHYTDGNYESFEESFNPDLTGEQWQYIAFPVVAKKDYTLFSVKLLYDYNVNTAYFDGIQLYKEQFGSSYTYDTEGKVISVVDLQKKNTTYEYNTDGDVTKILEDNNAKVTYTYYEDTHNVKTATTQKGVVYTFEYDAYGNNERVTIGDPANGAQVISSSAQYTTDGNYLLSTTDALAKVTTYGYNTDTGELEWVQYPEDTEATRTKYDYDTMYRMAMAECTTDTGLNQSVEYVYENDRLKEIETPTTAYQFGYGAFGQRSVVTASLYFLAYYYYTDDANRYLQQLEYGNYDTVNYTYDSKGRLLTQTYNNGDTVSYAYDNNGALATVTDSATGRTTTYYYDLTDRMMRYVEKGANFSHSVGYEYDSKNNLTQLVENINGTDRTTSYTYDDDNRVETVTVDGSSVVYTYDTYGRVEKQVTKHGTSSLLTKDYTFKNTVSADGQQLTSTQIATYKVTVGGVETEYAYTYDGNGNILTVTVGGNTTSYEYDSANQLIRENNQAGDFTHTWEYDAGGNILNRKEYGYTTGSLDNATPTDEITYTYDDVFWRDLLTEYDGKEIDRDEIGNPLTYDGWTYTWEHGRQLARAEKNGTTWDYTYNADGLRTSKSNGTETWNYVYNGSQLTQMTKDSNTLYFTYDANGTPLTLTYNGNIFYYETNLQGDVVRIRSYFGTSIVEYSYDAWGKVRSITGTAKDTIGKNNPLLYRGYVYDQESGLYYLQSRYYDPEIGRFINADGLVATGQGLLGNNMFAYCHNNPVLYVDPSGYIIDLAAGATEEQIAEYERAIAYLKTSETGKKLISLLETSEIKFYIVLNDNNKMKYTSQNHTIYFDTNCGLILLDGTSTMSPALGLAHEMGHAAQHLDGTLHPGSNRDIVEALNLETYEIPIANELGEPVRNHYDASRGSIDMNNSIHFRTTKIYTRPWWHYLAPWNWFRSNRVVTDHNQ